MASSEQSRSAHIAVATFSKPVLGLVGRLAQSGGISVTAVEPNEESILSALNASGQLVVLDVMQKDTDWMPLAKSILASHPDAKLVAFGGRADLAVVSKAIVLGVSHYLLDNTTSVDFVSAIKSVLADKIPSEDTMFGRVWSALPYPPNREGVCRTNSGERYSLEDAIKHCDQLGLSAEEIATRLKVSSSDLQSVLSQSRKAPPSSVLSRLADLLPDAKAEGTSSSGSSIKPLLAVLGMLLIVSMGWKLFAREPKTHAISGTVTFQSQPLKVGMIRFIPEGTSESSRPIVSGEIRDGRYRLKSGHRSDGGTYTAVISGFTGVPKQAGPVMDPLGDQLFPDITRTATVPCSDFTFNVRCD